MSTSSAPAGVTVVIPTVGRESLRDAVESCMSQTLAPSRIVVVPNGTGSTTAVQRALNDLLSVSSLHIAAETSPGGSRARNAGTDLVETQFVAYLDDDDVWQPEKLERQVEAAARHGRPAVVTCAASFVRSRSTRTYPLENPPEDPARTASWLVSRPDLRFGRSFVQSSTILIPADAARSLRWDEGLKKHQDWDFVIRAVEMLGALRQTPGPPLVNVVQASPGSVSKQAHWEASLEFLRRHPSIAGRARGDFGVIHVLSAAYASGGTAELRRALRALNLREVPHCAAIVVGLRGAISD